MSGLLRYVRNQWFLVVLFGCVVLGFTRPAAGLWLSNNVTLKSFIVVVIFLMSLGLRTRDIAESFLRVRGLSTALAGGYVLLPVLMYFASLAPFPPDIRVGLFIVAAGPTTLASAAIWTRLAGGNDALSLATTIISNALNFLVAPLILFLLVGQVQEMPASEALRMAKNLLVVIVIPVGAGQLVRWPLGEWADRSKKVNSVICRLLILCVVLMSVSRAAQEASGEAQGATLTAWTLGGLLLAVIVAHLVAAAACWWISGRLGAERRDRIATMFSGSQKTLPVGLFLASEFFPHHKFAALPILFYHASQLVLDSILVERLKRGGEEEPRE